MAATVAATSTARVTRSTARAGSRKPSRVHDSARRHAQLVARCAHRNAHLPLRRADSSVKGPRVLVQDVLRELDLGNSVAEFDTALERFFVETHTFRQLVLDKVDVVAGDKGTGKTALFRILQQRYREIPELSDVELIPAFNPVGNPVFQRLAEGEVLTEGQYITIWKAYILALVGNWVLGIVIDEMSPLQRQLDTLL